MLLSIFRNINNQHLSFTFGTTFTLAAPREELAQGVIFVFITFRFIHFLVVFAAAAATGIAFTVGRTARIFTSTRTGHGQFAACR